MNFQLLLFGFAFLIASTIAGLSSDLTDTANGTVTNVPGKVKWFNAEKGFGFLTPDDGGSDAFVHYSQIAENKTLTEGQNVQYDMIPGLKGPRASNVGLI